MGDDIVKYGFAFFLGWQIHWWLLVYVKKKGWITINHKKMNEDFQ